MITSSALLTHETCVVSLSLYTYTCAYITLGKQLLHMRWKLFRVLETISDGEYNFVSVGKMWMFPLEMSKFVPAHPSSCALQGSAIMMTAASETCHFYFYRLFLKSILNLKTPVFFLHLFHKAFLREAITGTLNQDIVLIILSNVCTVAWISAPQVCASGHFIQLHTKVSLNVHVLFCFFILWTALQPSLSFQIYNQWNSLFRSSVWELIILSYVMSNKCCFTPGLRATHWKLLLMRDFHCFMRNTFGFICKLSLRLFA